METKEKPLDDFGASSFNAYQRSVEHEAWSDKKHAITYHVLPDCRSEKRGEWNLDAAGCYTGKLSRSSTAPTGCTATRIPGVPCAVLCDLKSNLWQENATQATLPDAFKKELKFIYFSHIVLTVNSNRCIF